MVAFLSPDMFPSTYHRAGLMGDSSTSFRQMASVAIVTMFCPAASPVVYSKEKKSSFPKRTVLTSTSLQ